ncbi:hypothetical protein [Microbacterium murale]|uniref:Uncharacterized protein n=1 Tax=Microbacterium murale TaxID=1081040 RepID=A0ABU0P7S3_9MICO|nr:hypothetical protein [Microbacterium murale]MDQ0643368.1 hypothetical protein [Microbacterium murale]
MATATPAAGFFDGARRYATLRESFVRQSALTVGAAVVLTMLCVLESMLGGLRATQPGTPVILDLVSAFPAWAEWVLGDGVWWFALVCAAQFVTFQILSTPRLHHASRDTHGLRNRFSVLMQAAAALTTGGWLLAVIITLVVSFGLPETRSPSAGLLVFTGAAAGLALYLGTELRQYYGTDVLSDLRHAREQAAQEADAREADFSSVARDKLRLRWLIAIVASLIAVFLTGLLVAGISDGELAAPFWARVLLVASALVVLIFMQTWAARNASAVALRGLQMFLCFTLLAPASLLVGTTAMVILTPLILRTGDIAWFYGALAAFTVVAAGLVVATHFICRAHRLQNAGFGWTLPGVTLITESRQATARLAVLEAALKSEVDRLSGLEMRTAAAVTPSVTGSMRLPILGGVVAASVAIGALSAIAFGRRG